MRYKKAGSSHLQRKQYSGSAYIAIITTPTTTSHFSYSSIFIMHFKSIFVVAALASTAAASVLKYEPDCLMEPTAEQLTAAQDLAREEAAALIAQGFAGRVNSASAAQAVTTVPVYAHVVTTDDSHSASSAYVSVSMHATYLRPLPFPPTNLFAMNRRATSRPRSASSTAPTATPRSSSRTRRPTTRPTPTGPTLTTSWP